LLFNLKTNKGEWEINAETLFVEILDDKGLFFPMEKGRIVITSLFSPSVYSL
jgi:phenylacetate-CoA ligase